MTYELPSHDALLTEQAMVQAEKFQGRQLAEYDNYLFPLRGREGTYSSAVGDFVKPYLADDEQPGLRSLLRGMQQRTPERPVHWADMGGGRAVAMRQLACEEGTGDWLRMTNVDLFNYGLEGLEQSEVDYLETLMPGMTRPEAAPELIKGNVETVRLPVPAHVITSIEVMQYLHNPLGAIANWYNQLADDGLLLVATDLDWAEWIRNSQNYEGAMWDDETPTKQLLDVLAKHDINTAITLKEDAEYGFRPQADPGHFRILAIQKRPGTMLSVLRQPANVWTNSHGFKVVYYNKAEQDAPLVKVATVTSKNIGTVALNSAI